MLAGGLWGRLSLYSKLLFLALFACGLHAAGWLFPGAWLPAWLGQAGAVLLAVNCRPRLALLLGSIGGAFGIAGSFYWGVAALRQTFDATPVMAWTIFLGLVAIEGFGYGLFCFLVSVLAKCGVRWLWITPCAWVVAEYWFPRVFPWKLAYTQLQLTWLLQISDLVGPAGVGFLLTLVASAPVIVWLAYRHDKSLADRRSALAYAIAALVLLGCSLGYGAAQQRRYTNLCRIAPKLALALVQVDPIYVGSEKKLRERSFMVHDKVDLIVWPESSLGIYSEKLTHFRNPDEAQYLSRQSRELLEPAKGLDCHLLAGGKLYRDGAPAEGPYQMTAFLIAPNDDILGRYMKRTLLPFGEYIPFQQWFPAIREYATIHDVMEAGNDARPLVTETGHRLGNVICYEDTLPPNARHTVAQGAEALFSLIQGTAFENPLTLRQHLMMAAMRAVENRRYFVRCASTGVTCIIDPTGRVVSQLPVQTEGTLVGEIALIDSLSLYTRIGDLFPWVCTAVVGAALWFGRRRKNAAA